MSRGPLGEGDPQRLITLADYDAMQAAADTAERTMRIEKYGRGLGSALHDVLGEESEWATSEYRESDGAMAQLESFRLVFASHVATLLGSHDHKERTKGVEAQMEYARGVDKPHAPVPDTRPGVMG